MSGVHQTLIMLTSSPVHQVSSQSNDATTDTYPSYDDTYDTDERQSYGAVWDLQTYFIPVICSLGIVGNLSSVAVFLTGNLKKKSCIMYLITKCLSDTFFLAALSIVWLDHLDVRWFHRQGICQMVIFITYVSGFSSVWLVVLVTVENYVRICYPNTARAFCTPGKARGALLFLGIFSIFCYNFPLWTTYSKTLVSKRQCLPIPEFSLFNEGLTYFDTIMTLVLPSLLIFLFMAGILSAIITAYCRNRKGKALGRQRQLKHFCLSPYGRLTAMLTAVSVTFITLHTPSHIIRLRLLLGHLLGQAPTLSVVLYQRLFELFYYINFSLNVLTYLLFGKSFRTLHGRLFCRPCCSAEPAPGGGSGDSAQNICETSPNDDVETCHSVDLPDVTQGDSDVKRETLEMKPIDDLL